MAVEGEPCTLLRRESGRPFVLSPRLKLLRENLDLVTAFVRRVCGALFSFVEKPDKDFIKLLRNLKAADFSLRLAEAFTSPAAIEEERVAERVFIPAAVVNGGLLQCHLIYIYIYIYYLYVHVVSVIYVGCAINIKYIHLYGKYNQNIYLFV